MSAQFPVGLRLLVRVWGSVLSRDDAFTKFSGWGLLRMACGQQESCLPFYSVPGSHSFPFNKGASQYLLLLGSVSSNERKVGTGYNVSVFILVLTSASTLLPTPSFHLYHCWQLYSPL